MRLHAIRDGTVYATEGRDLLVGSGARQLVRVGRLPVGGGRDALGTRLLTSRHTRGLMERLVGAVTTVNVWPLTSSDLLATVGRRLYASRDHGRSWELVRRFPDSSGPMGILPSAIAHHDGTTYLGEYPLGDDTTPRVLVSHDDGRSWSTHLSLPDVRHVHAVQWDPYGEDLWVTTGDTDDESRIGRVRDGELEVVGSGSQEWRAVELGFTPAAVLWGMDCAYAEPNRIFRLPRDELDEADPTPEPVHDLGGSVYYSATLAVEGTQWVAFSTAMEAGRDSTGPATQAAGNERGVVVAASDASDFTDWHELASFRRRSGLTERLPGSLPRANGYVFLEADPRGGLFVNPYNSASDDGSIQQIPPDRFARLAPRPAQ